MNAENYREDSQKTKVSRRPPAFVHQQKRVVWKVDQLTKKLKIDTQSMRQQLLFQLQALFDNINSLAIDTSAKDWKQKEAWARMAAYIAQTINSITNTYDENRAIELMEDLEKKMKEDQYSWEKLNQPKPEKFIESKSSDGTQTSSQSSFEQSAKADS